MKLMPALLCLLPAMAFGQAMPDLKKPITVDPKFKAEVQAKYNLLAPLTTKRDFKAIAAKYSSWGLIELVYIRNSSESANRQNIAKFVSDSWKKMLSSNSSSFKVTKIAKYPDRSLAIVVRDINGTAKDLKGKPVKATLRTYYQDEWQTTAKGQALFVVRELRSELLVNGKNILPKTKGGRVKVGIRPVRGFVPKAAIKPGGG